MSATKYITISAEAQALLDRLQVAPVERAKAMMAATDRQNALTVSHIIRAYLSFPSAGPSQATGLRAQTGSLRRSLRASKCTYGPGGLTSGIGGDVTNRGVNYLAVHEFGATIPPHTISATNARALCFFVGGKKVFAKSVKHPGMTLPARGMIQRGIEDRLPQYGAALSAAVISKLGGKN